MSRHARTTSLHRPTTSGLQLAQAAARPAAEAARLRPTERTRSMPGGKMVAGASSRATPLPSFARRPRRAIAESIQATPSTDALRATVPETAQVLVLVCNLRFTCFAPQFTMEDAMHRRWLPKQAEAASSPALSRAPRPLLGHHAEGDGLGWLLRRGAGGSGGGASKSYPRAPPRSSRVRVARLPKRSAPSLTPRDDKRLPIVSPSDVLLTRLQAYARYARRTA